MTRALHQSSAFVRSARRYLRKHPDAEESLHQTFRRLESDAFDPRLRTHKLKGDLSSCWACSGGYDLRIIFKVVTHAGAETILLLSIGTHDEVY